jgi:hypothetical protein
MLLSWQIMQFITESARPGIHWHLHCDTTTHCDTTMGKNCSVITSISEHKGQFFELEEMISFGYLECQLVQWSLHV